MTEDRTRARGHSVRTMAVTLVAVLAVSGSLAGIAVLRGGQQTLGNSLPLARPQALLVLAGSNERLLLGTPRGLFLSEDGGRSWRKDAFDRKDVLGLAQARDGTIWAAGHLVLATSTDSGETWRSVRPRGLPSLDVHGFALDPNDRHRVWVAIGGAGLFLSTDGGQRFMLRSRDVGPDVVSLAMSDSMLLAADAARDDLMASRDDGATWATILSELPTSLATNPLRPDRVIAAAGHILFSSDGGKTWKRSPEAGSDVTAVAWEPRPTPSAALGAAASGALWRLDPSARAWSEIVRGRATER